MERSTLILSVPYRFSGPFSRVPFFCFRIFTPVQTRAHLGQPLSHLSPGLCCTLSSSIAYSTSVLHWIVPPSFTKQKQRKRKNPSTDGFLLNPTAPWHLSPCLWRVCRCVCTLQITLSSSLGSQEACSGKSRSSPDWHTSCLSTPPSSSCYLALVLPIKAPAVPTWADSMQFRQHISSVLVLLRK